MYAEGWKKVGRRSFLNFVFSEMETENIGSVLQKKVKTNEA